MFLSIWQGARDCPSGWVGHSRCGPQLWRPAPGVCGSWWGCGLFLLEERYKKILVPKKNLFLISPWNDFLQIWHEFKSSTSSRAIDLKAWKVWRNKKKVHGIVDAAKESWLKQTSRNSPSMISLHCQNNKCQERPFSASRPALQHSQNISQPLAGFLAHLRIIFWTLLPALCVP